MQKVLVTATSLAVTLFSLSSAFAVLPNPAYVDAKSGNNSNAGIGCPVSNPCADLNTALSVIAANGQVIILESAVFGPIVLTSGVTITGTEPNTHIQIVADPTAQVGCVGHLPASCALTNNGYAVEVAVPATDSVSISHVLMSAGINGGAGALKLTSGALLELNYDIFRGRGDTAPGPIVALYPNNPGTTQAQVYFSNSDVGLNGSGPAAGAIEVKPSGSTSLKLHFNHVAVHNASYGIRTDSSLVSGPAVTVATVVSESEFFSFPNAAVNAFSTPGGGTTNAVFDTVKVLNALVAIKANGPQSSVVLTNSTISGNGTGVQVLSSAQVKSSGNNTIQNNGVDVSGTLTAAPQS